MPGLTPGRRWQPAYYPFHNDSLFNRILQFVERAVKEPLFGCRMCGNCLLQETAFICPMECPKGLRNGPCGGSTPDHCYVDPTRPCIWYRIYQRAESLGREDRLMEVLPPLDWDLVGRDQWGEIIRKWAHSGGLSGSLNLLRLSPQQRRERIEDFFYSFRQPEWWQGDSLPHPPPPHEPVSTLEQKLLQGEFVVTAEVAPPLAASAQELVTKFDLLRGLVDAVNFTDNPSATSRMSPLASSVLCLQNGLEPIMQIAARDYNRMGVQSTVLGASALGIRNILCLTGDHSRLGPQPHSRMDIWDFDSVQLAWMLRKMRDEGRFLDQRGIEPSPPLFIGAAASPNSATPRIEAQRDLKKIHAGVQYFQTNLVYDLHSLQDYLEELDKIGALGKAYFLVGVVPIRSHKAAQIISKVPGIKIPGEVLKRLEASTDPKEEGVQIALEFVSQVHNLPGVHGIHFMAVGWESIVPRIIRESGLRVVEIG